MAHDNRTNPVLSCIKSVIGKHYILSRMLDYRYYLIIRLASGYERFYYIKGDLMPADSYTRRKRDILFGEMRAVIPNRTVLDLGSATGFFSLLSGCMGAKEVLGLDVDRGAISRSRKIAKHMGLDAVKFQEKSVYELNEEYRHDTVLAFAIIHWFMDPIKRPQYDKFEPIVKYLRSLTGKHLFVEYVSPDDASFSNLTGAQRDAMRLEAFSRGNLLACLNKQFASVKVLGKSRQTRELFMASL